MITKIEEETQDIDWFSVDADGAVAHFASGGRGFLPSSVKASRNNLNHLIAFFRRELPVNGGGMESLALYSHMRFQSDAQKTMYLADYSRMGAKGLYSFDCVIGPGRPSSYFAVVVPSRPVNINDLPHEIQQILRLTQFPGTFSSSDTVQEKDFE